MPISETSHSPTSQSRADQAVSLADPGRFAMAPVLPDTGFVRQNVLLRFVPFSKATLWRRVKSRDFPAPVKLSVGVTAWRAEDVRAWILKRS